MIRHVITPTITFSGAPDFGSSFFGYYGQYDRPWPTEPCSGRLIHISRMLSSEPPRRESREPSAFLHNTTDEVAERQSLTGEKRISLIENFTIGQSYNFAADSLNWSNINTSIMLPPAWGRTGTLTGKTWDVYTYQLNSAGNPVRAISRAGKVKGGASVVTQARRSAIHSTTTRSSERRTTTRRPMLQSSSLKTRRTSIPRRRTTATVTTAAVGYGVPRRLHEMGGAVEPDAELQRQLRLRSFSTTINWRYKGKITRTCRCREASVHVELEFQFLGVV